MMNIMIWMLAGGAIGYASLAMLGFNEQRGILVSVIIGALGGFVGGDVIAPMMMGKPAAGTVAAFSFVALFLAAACAAACLAVGNLIERRYGV